MKSKVKISSAASYRHKCVRRPSLIPCLCPAGHWTVSIWSESGSSIQSHIGWTKSDHKTGSLCWLQAHYKSTDHIWSSTKLNRVQHGHLTCYEPAAKRQAVRMCVQKLWKNVNCQNDYVQNHIPTVPEEPWVHVSCIIVPKPENFRTVKGQPENP